MYEEEGVAYDISEEKDSESSSHRRGFGLDLSKAAKGHKDDASIQETCVTVVFELPDGSQAEQTVCKIFYFLSHFYLVQTRIHCGSAESLRRKRIWYSHDGARALPR